MVKTWILSDYSFFYVIIRILLGSPSARSLCYKMSSYKDIPSFYPFVSSKGAAILDGGMTTSLDPEAGQHFLWGMQLLFSKKGLDQLYNVHYNFLAAGADAIETLSYKLSEEISTKENV